MDEVSRARRSRHGIGTTLFGAAYVRASSAVRNSTLEELAELDELSAEALEGDG